MALESRSISQVKARARAELTERCDLYLCWKSGLSFSGHQSVSQSLFASSNGLSHIAVIAV